MSLKCFICAKDFVTKLAVVCESIGIMFGFHVVPDQTQPVVLIVAQWTEIWARVQLLNKSFKILRSIEGALKHKIMVRGNFIRTYKRKVSFYFTFYIISNNRIQSFIYETKGSDLWYLILCFAYAPFVPNTLQRCAGRQ